MTSPLENKAVAEKPQTNSNKNRNFFWLTVIIALIVLICFFAWLFYFRFYESTEDAYVNGNIVNVTTAIEGTPVAYFADDTDLVEKGQLLALLDMTEYRIRYEQELANLSLAAQKVKQLYDTVKANQINVHNKKIALEKARFDYDNRKNLVNSKAVSNEDYTHSQDAYRSAELDLKYAEQQLQIAFDAAGSTSMQDHPMIEVQKNSVRNAFYKLSHCTIYAPIKGYVAKRSVQVGQWTTPKTPLMAIIPSDYMWVDANFKETQLKNMRIGQPVKVTFDLYGRNVKFEGKVLGIASGTGSVFSLIPPQNATGNWIKIVQRLAVRIGLESQMMKKYPLRLGLSSTVEVDISNTDLPVLTTLIHNNPIETTSVYDLNFNEIEKLMDHIINKQFEESYSSVIYDS